MIFCADCRFLWFLVMKTSNIFLLLSYLRRLLIKLQFKTNFCYSFKENKQL
jgi:hypothetical protein